MDNQPVTKRDLEEAFARFKHEFKTELKTELKAELKAELDQRDEGLREMIRDMQTELLKAFLPFQETTHIRFRGLEETDENTKARLDVLERRVAEIEKKILQPPSA